MNNNIINCCPKIKIAFSDQRVSIGYQPKYREYFLDMRKEKSIVYLINNCPWCGKKLPKSLRKQWFSTLKKECNIKDPWHKDESRVPEEFKTDEWWKKRNL